MIKESNFEQMCNRVENKRGLTGIPTIASILNGILFAPLELGSTRSKSRDTTVRGFKLISQVYSNEGLLALWRGSGWFVAGNAAARTTWLVSYDRIKQKLLEHKKIVNPDTIKLGNIELMGAGFGAGAITAIITNPIWILKSFSQLPNYPGILYSPGTHIARFLTNPKKYYHDPLVAENRRLTLHPHSLMAGTIPGIGYVATESMFQLFILEKLKDWTIDYTQGLSPLHMGIVGGLLGGISRIIILPVTFPLHVVTLRAREQYKPIIREANNIKPVLERTNKQTIVQIYKRIHAEKAWYAGIGPYTARVAPQSMILFFMIEAFRSALN